MAIELRAAVVLQDFFTRTMNSISSAAHSASENIQGFADSTARADSASLDGMSSSINRIQRAIQALTQEQRRLSASADPSGIIRTQREINRLRELMGRARTAQEQVNIAICSGNADRLTQSYERFNQ